MNQNDKQWQIFNKQLLTHAQNFDWGLYRNTRLDMAEFLSKEKKYENALETYLEICYLDLNGPSNMGGINDPAMFKEFPPFDPKVAFLAPGIIDRIKKIIKKIEFNQEKIKEIYIKHNDKIEKALKLPLSPEKCWESIEKELKK